MAEEAKPQAAEKRSLPYTWTQTLQECTVNIPIEPNVAGRDLVVDIKKDRLLVKFKNGNRIIVDGELHKLVKPADSLWSIDSGKDGKKIVIELSKVNQMEWWSCILKGDPEIDTTKIEPENSKLSDLDGETRQMVEKMMFDQKQKALGLPTSEEMQKQETLRKFMSQHPEMDFSQAKMM